MLKTAGRSFAMGDDSAMIRTCSDHDTNPHSSSRTRPFAEVSFRIFENHFLLEHVAFRLSHQILELPIALRLLQRVALQRQCCACHEKSYFDSTKCCMLRVPKKVTLQHHQMRRLLRRFTLQHHKTAHPSRKVKCE